jgi:4-oxalomesaconate hydratase
MDKRRLLVIVAHPGDFVWRASGAIALHLANGWRVQVICASLGVKGEAGSLWKSPGATLESVSEARRQEVANAASILNVEMKLLTMGDYPLLPTAPDTLQVSRFMREFRPSIVLTHPPKDPANADHANVSEMVMQARTFASAPGYGGDVITPPNVYFFEPHQPELCEFKADLFLDITEYWSLKLQAFRAIESQRNVWDYYERVAMQRGAQAGRRSAKPILQAEAYQRAFPSVVHSF